MTEDFKEKLSQILNEVGNNDVRLQKENVEKLLLSKEGRKLSEVLKKTDKEKLVEQFMKMDSGELKKRLSNTDLSKIRAEDILKKLR